MLTFLVWFIRFGCLWYMSSHDRQNTWLEHFSQRTFGLEDPHKSQCRPSPRFASIFPPTKLKMTPSYNLQSRCKRTTGSPNLIENVAFWAFWLEVYSISSYSSSKGGGWVVGNGGGVVRAAAVAASMSDTDLFSACDLAGVICWIFGQSTPEKKKQHFKITNRLVENCIQKDPPFHHNNSPTT